MESPNLKVVFEKYCIPPTPCWSQVGDGWVPIIEKLIQELIAIGWDKVLHQVKEKFGGLRFYCGHTTDEMDALINDAEAEADKTCEYCGQPGMMNCTKANGTRAWIKTLCTACIKKEGRMVAEDVAD